MAVLSAVVVRVVFARLSSKSGEFRSFPAQQRSRAAPTRQCYYSLRGGKCAGLMCARGWHPDYCRDGPALYDSCGSNPRHTRT